MAAQPPFARNASLTTSTADPLTLENGFPAEPSQTITNTYAIDKNYKLAYAQTWSFALQQTFSHGLLVELEYIGTKGTGCPLPSSRTARRRDRRRSLRSSNCKSATPPAFRT